MTAHDQHRHHDEPRPARRRPSILHRWHLVLTVALGIALVAMVIGHWQALLSGNVLAIALVAACLLLHPLMHRGHGDHGGTGVRRDDPT